MDDLSTNNVPGALPEIDRRADGIETELGWALSAMFQGYSRSGAVAVADVPGGPRGYQVLVAITAEKPSSQLALAHRLGIDKTQMTYVIDALETGGYVERRPDPTDRRIRQVLPTKAGRSLLDSARVALRDVEGVLMRDLSTDEQTQLRQLLARVALGVGDVESRMADVRTAPE
jgi:DNA-binding MarR family transcriptional regulator